LTAALCSCNLPHQEGSDKIDPLQAFDGGLDHKWLDFGGANGGMTWLEYRLLPAQPAVAVTRYSLTSAEDEPNRDPCDFVLEGSVETLTASGVIIRKPARQSGNFACISSGVVCDSLSFNGTCTCHAKLRQPLCFALLCTGPNKL